MRIALTADLHWGLSPTGDEATRQLANTLYAETPDLLVLGGDLGTREHFAECLELFAALPCRKALVPGNHDIWVEPEDARGNSIDLYERVLPETARRYGFHYLDLGPLILPEAGLALVGCMNWYDYSWSLAKLPFAAADWETRLLQKRFTRGRHNDANFVRWPTDDVQFTRQSVTRFREHLAAALPSDASEPPRRVIAVTHHPCFYGLTAPLKQPPTLDGLLWDAFSGNRAMELALTEFADHIAFAFCGHTHRARENTLGPIRGYNLGGDYHFKRLLRLEWPEGFVSAVEFRGTT